MPAVRHRRGRSHAFTLVEAAITVAILAMAVGVVLVSWSSGRADLRSAAGKLSGTIRATFDNAALSGQVHRLVFDFASRVVKVEATEALLSFDEDQNPLRRGAAAPLADPLAGLGGALGLGGLLAAQDANAVDDALDQLEDQGPPSALQALLGLNQAAADEATAGFSSIERDLDLGDGVQLLSVWVQGMREPTKEGIVYLYFFTQGYTQDALVHLQDEEGAVFTIKVAALTGRTEVTPEYVEVPR